eukprot:1136541-Pelagomonas_calceolata.AAC.3
MSHPHLSTQALPESQCHVDERWKMLFCISTPDLHVLKITMLCRTCREINVQWCSRLALLGLLCSPLDEGSAKKGDTGACKVSLYCSNFNVFHSIYETSESVQLLLFNQPIQPANKGHTGMI